MLSAEWGNRRRIVTKYTLGNQSGETTKTEWYSYNKDNQVLVEGSEVVNGEVVATKRQGVVYRYVNGNRATQEKYKADATYRSGYVDSDRHQVWNGERTTYALNYQLTTFTYNDLGLLVETNESSNVRSGSNATSSSRLSTSDDTVATQNTPSGTIWWIDNGSGTQERIVRNYDNRGFQTSLYNYNAGSSQVNYHMVSSFTDDGLLKTQDKYNSGNQWLYNITNNYKALSNCAGAFVVGIVVDGFFCACTADTAT